jgi:uncharacterized protein (TIGR02996 family)
LSSHDAAGLFRAILAAPDDDLPRLYYADVVERSQPERAEFIRVQCELAKCQREQDPDCVRSYSPETHLLTNGQAGACGTCWDALRRRERELLRDHGTAWANAVAPPVEFPDPIPAGVFVRGFVSQLTVSWDLWHRHAAALLAVCPIRRVNKGKPCVRCAGSGELRHPDWAEYNCPECNATGKVDDWRGDGLVRLTTWPHWGDARPCGACQDCTSRAPRLCERTAGIFGREWPTVRFELPAARNPWPGHPVENDAPYSATGWTHIDEPRRLADTLR